MKRLVWMLLLLLLVTGCEAEYNLTINKATIDEQFQIYEKDPNKWDSNVELFSLSFKDVINNNLQYKTGIYIDEQLNDTEEDNNNYIFYKPVKINTKEKLGILYKYKFSVDRYEKAYFPNNCFDNIKVYQEKGNIILSTSKGFNCLEKEYNLSSLTINITTKYEVLNNNSDTVDGRTYKWIINEDNYQDKNIYIKVNTKKLSNVKINSDKENDIVKLFLTFGVAIAILLIIVIIFLANKKRKLENM